MYIGIWNIEIKKHKTNLQNASCMNKKRQQFFTTARAFNLLQKLGTAWSQLEHALPGGLQPRERPTLGKRRGRSSPEKLEGTDHSPILTFLGFSAFFVTHIYLLEGKWVICAVTERGWVRNARQCCCLEADTDACLAKEESSHSCMQLVIFHDLNYT